MLVYIKMEKPLVFDDETSLEWAREVFANGSAEFPQLMPREWVAEVTHNGEYDGIIFDPVALGWKFGKMEIIMFKANQVKSALSNTSDFSTHDDITK